MEYAYLLPEDIVLKGQEQNFLFSISSHPETGDSRGRLSHDVHGNRIVIINTNLHYEALNQHMLKLFQDFRKNPNAYLHLEP